MNRHLIPTMIPALLIAAAAGVAPAQPLSEQFLYQGELTDSGVPADGNYDFVFRLYDAPSGGSVIGTPISRPNLTVEDGYIQTSVGFGGIGLIFDGDRRWLEVDVRPAGSGSYTTLGRTEVTATPYASYAINAETADLADFAEFSGTTLDEAYDNGGAIDADNGPVSIINTTSAPGFPAAELWLGGEGSRQGEMRVFNFAGVRTLELGSFNQGGYVQGYGATGDTIWQLAPDTSTFGGARLSVNRRTGSGSGGGGTSSGIVLEGNWAGTERSRLTMFGESQNVQIAMDLNGDDTVQLPTDAINASEIRNETGVASSASSGGITLTALGSTLDDIQSATINCPTSGFVLAIATVEASVSHVNGLDSLVNLGVSDSSQSLSSSQDVELRIEDSTPTGSYDHPVTVHGVFPVGPGSRTFYLVGDQNSIGQNIIVNDATLSLIFVPTSYGGVTGSRAAPGGLPDELSPRQLGGLTPEQVIGEQMMSEQANRDRITRELAEMRDRMARLERELNAELSTDGEVR